MSATVFRSLEQARGRFGPCAVAIGNFDGVHRGHQALLDASVRFAKSCQLYPAVLTFDPHPAAIVAPERLPQAICTLDERIGLLQKYGAERILVLPFTTEVAHMTPREFISQILVNALETKAVFVGENFRFGYRQSGNTDTLRELGLQFGFERKFLEPITVRGEIVSSSAIRRYLAAGDVTRAGRLLNRCFFVEGPVVRGRGIGAKQTVPTLNLQPVSGQIVPRGIYITETTEARTGRCWPSVTSCGTNPTFGESELTIETFLLSPLTGESPQEIRVKFRRFLRLEERFPTAAELKAQILRDVVRAQSYWRRMERFGHSAASIY
ncbi:MAG TPA: bifunctional riboflavin kinase/FAD synthetase [Bryobacteraceae bacterium]